VMLTTVGRRTGSVRTTMVVAPVCLDETLVLVASNGGAPRHPSWYLNLSAHPDVEVLFKGERRKMRARTAGAQEKPVLWRQVVANAPSYATYQSRTSRDIPVVLLEPRQPARR
jgi:deazaflavin-dependent oxidoreductase (nitroreductase family)